MYETGVEQNCREGDTAGVAQTNQGEPGSAARPRTSSKALILLLVYVLGLGTGYLFWGRAPIAPLAIDSRARASSPNQNASSQEPPAPAGQVAAADQVALPDGYSIPVSFGDAGPRLLEAGAINYDAFVQVYQQAGQPLSQAQLKILTEGSDAPITIDRDNAYFLLNFFWALGLTNENPILKEGLMVEKSQGEIGRYASTGGWTIGRKSPTALYASTTIIKLTPEQQARLEEVAEAVYRPCCDNHTAFPDCNHGMAMLGLLELMASQDASADEMFEAAKYANAFWFPQQTLEMAVFFKASKGLDFEEVDARELVGREVSSGSGFQAIHEWLGQNGLLEQGPGRGSSCGV
jgi:hypothetical protein